MPFHGIHIPLRGSSYTKVDIYRPRDPADMHTLFEPAPNASDRLKDLIVIWKEIREEVRTCELHLVPGIIYHHLLEGLETLDATFRVCRDAWGCGKNSPQEMNQHRIKIDSLFQLAVITNGVIMNIAEEHELRCLEILKEGSSNFHLISKKSRDRKTQQIKYLTEKPFNALFIDKQVLKVARDEQYLINHIPGVMVPEIDGDLIQQCNLTADDLVRVETLPICPKDSLGGVGFEWAQGTGEFENASEGYRMSDWFREAFTPVMESNFNGWGSFLSALLNDDIAPDLTPGMLNETNLIACQDN
ncbi:hypothetical protein H4I95_05687 [Botrytis cinerea]